MAGSLEKTCEREGGERAADGSRRTGDDLHGWPACARLEEAGEGGLGSWLDCWRGWRKQGEAALGARTGARAADRPWRAEGRPLSLRDKIGCVARSSTRTRGALSSGTGGRSSIPTREASPPPDEGGGRSFGREPSAVASVM